ncbi:Dynein beta chain ciliary, partial [Dissostichus eleginoides]
MSAGSWSSLHLTLLQLLDGYNQVNAKLNLVLFEDAMAHICRINRILESPRGNALLVGVGGSGKQSLTRVAAFISNLEVFQISLRRGYSIADLKTDLASLCFKAGVKNIGTVFLLTDTQVSDDKFLVLVNDLLASGSIAVHKTAVHAILYHIDFYISSDVLLHPTSAELQLVGIYPDIILRRFPALVNCTAIDWFHEWPQEALESISFKFLQDVEKIEPQVKQSVSKFMAFVHTTVNHTSKEYLANERRYNYTTPKSFLEQIQLYGSLLRLKSSELTSRMERPAETQQHLHPDLIKILVTVVGIETEKVSKEKAIADEEEQKVAAIAVVVSGKQRDCEEDLQKAEPTLLAAQDALHTLNK